MSTKYQEKIYSDDNTQWHWVNSKKGKYLQANSLRERGFAHGFFTNEWSTNSPKQISNYLNPSHSVHLCTQVHSSKIIEASKAIESIPPEADGLISNRGNQGLWIYTADCVPILFADPVNSIICASHAGWKGLAKNILSKAIVRLEKSGADKRELIIAIGPCISMKNYQVDFELIDYLYNSICVEDTNNIIMSKDKISILAESGAISYDINPNKFLLNIRIAAANQLYQAGIKKKQLSISNLCTFDNQDLFNSWRRTKTKAIQWSTIAN